MLGTVLQLIVMPAVGIALARLYDLPPALAAGLVVCAACPGGGAAKTCEPMGTAKTCLTSDQLRRLDVNGDSFIDGGDARTLQKIQLGWARFGEKVVVDWS